MNAYERMEAIKIDNNCGPQCEAENNCFECPVWINKIKPVYEEILEIEEAQEKDLEDELLIQEGFMDADGNVPCWVCGKWTKERFCSDKCEQQYVKDMEAQGENIDFDGEEDIP